MKLNWKGWAGIALIFLFLAVAGIALETHTHTSIHWLDDARHEMASTFAWESVKTNLGAWPWQAALAGIGAALIYPPTRRWVERELDHLHAKLDHLIEKNPNVENLPEHMKGRSWSIHQRQK